MAADGAGRRAAWTGAGLALALAVPLVAAQPYWQTVDDAFMAMIVHGYGISAAPSPGLVFSSMLYGALLGMLPPTFGGGQTYGVATYALLAAAAAGSAYALWRAAVPGVLAAAAIVAVFAPAVLYPQFTEIAGLLAATAVMLLAAEARPAGAALAALLLVMAALVRAEQALLTLLLTSPLWLPGLLRAPRARLVAGAAVLALFLGAVATTVLTDRAYYSAPEWRQFMAMNKLRILFTDYGLTPYFFREPLDAMRLGWTPNDLVMIEGWFFADPRVYTPDRVEQLVSQVWIPGWILSNLRRFELALAPFTSEAFLAVLLLAVLAAWNLRARSRVALWALAGLGGAMLLALAAGRPGVTRIFLAPLAGIALLALVAQPAPLPRWQAMILAAGLAFAAAALGLRNADDRAEEREVRASACRLPAERLYVVWGQRLHYEKLYRPLSAPGDGCMLRLYPLAVHAYAPYSLERLRAATGAGDVVGVLLAEQPLDMIASSWQVDVLRRHLRRHYGRSLQWRLMSGDGGRGTWYQLRAPGAGGG